MSEGHEDGTHRSLCVTKELAEDVERWLANEMVHAHRYTLPEKCVQLCSKYRNEFFATMVVLFLAVVGLGIAYGIIHAQSLDLIAANQRAEANLGKARELAWELLVTADYELSAYPVQHQKRIALTSLVREQLAQLATESPHNDEIKQYYAQALRFEGNLFRSLQRYKEAERNYDQALRQLKSIKEPSPKTRDLMSEFLRDRAALLKNMGRLNEASKNIEESLALAESLLKDFPVETNYQRTKAIALLVKADLCSEFRRDEDREKFARQAAEAFFRLARSPNGHSRDDALYVHCMIHWAEARVEVADDARTAIQLLANGVEHARTKFAIQTHPDYKLTYAAALSSLGKTQLRFNQTSAETTLTNAIEELSELEDLFAIYPNFAREMINALIARATSYIHFTGDLARAEQDLLLADRHFEMYLTK